MPSKDIGRQTILFTGRTKRKRVLTNMPRCFLFQEGFVATISNVESLSIAKADKVGEVVEKRNQ